MNKVSIALISALIGSLGTLLSTELIINQNLKDTRIETFKEIILEFGDTDELWKLKAQPNEKWYRMSDYIAIVSLTGSDDVKEKLKYLYETSGPEKFSNKQAFKDSYSKNWNQLKVSMESAIK